MSESIVEPIRIAPGTVIDGRFRLDDKLGEGGFGTVFAATQLSTGQRVAVKVMHNETVRDSSIGQQRVARFEREMQLIAQLHHPNIVRLLDSGRVGETLYAVLEFVDGKPLSDVIVAEGGLAPDVALRLMSQVLDALSTAHEAGIVHRDLKPDNIMVVASGARQNALVLDFGIAGLTEAPANADGPPGRLTATGQFIGTPQYMAQEQLTGAPPTVQTDIYAWGLVFIEALTGHVAVDADSLHAVLFKQMNDAPVPLPTPLEGTSLGAVLRKATAKALESRYQDAASALDDLDEVAREIHTMPDLRRTAPQKKSVGGAALTGTIDGDVSLATARGDGYDATSDQHQLPDEDELDAPRVPAESPKPAPEPQPAPIPPTAVSPVRASEADDEPDPIPPGNRGLLIGIVALVGLIVVALVVMFVVLADAPSDEKDAPEAASDPETATTTETTTTDPAPPTEQTATTEPAAPEADGDVAEPPDAVAPAAPSIADGATIPDPNGEMVATHGGTLAAPAGADAVLQALCAQASDSCSPEAIARRVRIHDGPVAPFAIDRSEVTHAQWGACVAAGECTAPSFADCTLLNRSGRMVTPLAENLSDAAIDQLAANLSKPELPVVCVTHAEAAGFCTWAGKRLPSAAEHQWVSTAGGARVFPWGNGFDRATRANSADHTLVAERGWPLDALPVPARGDDAWTDGHPYIAPAASFPDGATPSGIVDLSGNVAEWIADGPRVRGGSWLTTGHEITGLAELGFDKDTRRTDVGFRCARDLD